MCKRAYMGIILAMMTIVTLGYLCFLRTNTVFLQIVDKTPCISIRMAQSENTIMLWQSEEGGKDYFFLPSCVNHHRIKLRDCGNSRVWIDGQLFERGDRFVWEDDHVYQMEIIGDDYEKHEYSITFMKSANIPAVFISTASGSMEYLNEDKQNRETGDMCIVREDGNTEYQGELSWISGRGNTTWPYEKKPYAIKLQDTMPLLGLDRSDRWQLMALWRESSKMDNKIAMDMADALGISYTAQGTWIDLYLNGEYSGIYMLAESVTVGEGRIDIYDLEKENKSRNALIAEGVAVHYEEENSKGYELENGTDISGGYLIEKDYPSHWKGEACGFVLPSEANFTIKEPKHASREQIDYIQTYVEEIDRLVQNSDSGVWQYLDLDSFVKRFLVDEISLEADAGLTSMFFYKDRGDDLLYSGPVWDYDRAFGEAGATAFTDYTETIIHNNERVAYVIDWYQRLYETPEMQRCVAEEYARLLPFFEELLNSRIDEYANRIQASVKMDGIRWEETWGPDDGMPRYMDYDANVSYMKYFLANRLNYLCERWGIDHEAFAAPAGGETHQLTFAVKEGVVETIEVMDGEPIPYTPDYDESVYQGWVVKRTGERANSYIPVYEDMEVYNGKWE
ncbi:MAG: hypothetical protein HDR05_15415 [Lachnospiraceae bacterium]|nr:hypothetical protein [Lachnospiraceae bacterium]